MGDLTFGVKLTADGKQLRGEVVASREEFDKLGTSVQRAAGKMASDYSGLNKTIKEHAAAVTDTEGKVTKLLDRYDPLGAKLRQLQADFKALDSAAASGKIAGRDDARVDAVYAKMRQEMEGAGKASVNLGLNSQYARREIMMLGKEALTGDFSRMPQTFGALATHSNLLQAAMSPAGIAVAVTAAAVGGLAVAFVQGARETKAMNDAIAFTGDYAGVTRGHIVGLAAEISRTSTLTIGASKEIVTQLVSSGRIGEQSLGAIAQMADTYAAATGKNIDTIGADLAKLFDDPAKGAEELNKRMHFLNAADLEYIGHLVRIGEEEKARLVLAEKFNASVPKHVENIGLLEKAWNAAAKGASAFWSGAMGVGQASTTEESLQQRIESITKFNARGQAIPVGLQNEYSALVAQLNKESGAASARAVTAGNNDQGVAAQSIIDKTLKLDRIRAKQDEITRLDAANKKELVDTKQYLDARKVLEKELADLQKPEKAKRAKTDPNDTAVASFQAEQFRKEMDLLGVSAEQVKVYELAMRGATDTQIRNAQAAADAIVPLNAELEARKKLQKQVEDSAKGGAILGRLGGDFDAEISKKNRALNDATMSAADKQHADNLDTVAQRAAKAREELAKLGITEEARAQLLVSVGQVEAEQIRRMEELRQQVEKNNASWEYGANVALRNYRDEAANVAKQSESLFTKAFKGAEDAVTKFAITGKLSIRDFAQTCIEEFYRINVSRPLVSAGTGFLGDLFGGMFGGGGDYSSVAAGALASANGNVFSGAGISAYSGSVVDRPTLFPFARGTGLMGEAGPEAILPLTRINGKLGVQASGGGGSSVVVNVIESPGKGGQQQQRSEGGTKFIDVFVEQIKSAIAGDISRGSGAVPAAMAQSYGLNRVAGSY